MTAMMKRSELLLGRPSYGFLDEGIVRTVRLGNKTVSEFLTGRIGEADDPEKCWHIARLRGATPRAAVSLTGVVGIVDLFCGAGGLAWGVREAVKATGRRPVILAAVDQDWAALDVHSYNLSPRRTLAVSVRDLLRVEPLTGSSEPRLVSPGEILMPSWPHGLSEAELVVGGPPCQGHSNLNNRTRRNDPRNELYLWMAATAHAVQAKAVIVENVASVKNDAGEAVERTVALFDAMGYEITFDGVLPADDFGVAQTRRRHFMVAVRRDVLADAAAAQARAWLADSRGPRLTVMDAIQDLESLDERGDYDTPSQLSDENQGRVEWLHRNDEYNLPNHLRPTSHRDGHTYPSVYGRIYGDRPAQTLSTGFLSPGRGRFTHPTRPRALTLHEAARIQGIPDDFRFIGNSGTIPNRTQVARMIGDSVPPPLAFHVTLATLQMLAH